MVERTLPKPDTRVRFPSAAPQAPDLTVWGFIFFAGRGGMFLAPTGNPSSLRVGHPDVATEHTGLSPASLPLSGQVE